MLLVEIHIIKENKKGTIVDDESHDLPIVAEKKEKKQFNKISLRIYRFFYLT